MFLGWQTEFESGSLIDNFWRQMERCHVREELIGEESVSISEIFSLKLAAAIRVVALVNVFSTLVLGWSPLTHSRLVCTGKVCVSYCSGSILRWTVLHVTDNAQGYHGPRLAFINLY